MKRTSSGHHCDVTMKPSPDLLGHSSSEKGPANKSVGRKPIFRRNPIFPNKLASLADAIAISEI